MEGDCDGVRVLEGVWVPVVVRVLEVVWVGVTEGVPDLEAVCEGVRVLDGVWVPVEDRVPVIEPDLEGVPDLENV